MSDTEALSPPDSTPPGSQAAPSRACPTCGAAGQERFCPACGQQRIDGRHTLRRFARSALARFIGEEGFFHTASELLLRPGRVIGDYLAGRTVRYVNPVGYLLVTAAVFTIVGELVGGASGAPESDRLWLILVLPFVALASRLLWWRGPYNIAEHLIIVLFLGAQVLVVLTVFFPGVLVVPTGYRRAYSAAALGAGAVFYVWAYAQAFPRRRFLAGLAASVALVLGSAAWFLALMFILGLLRD